MKFFSIILISLGALSMGVVGVYWFLNYQRNIKQMIPVEKFVGNAEVPNKKPAHLEYIRNITCLMLAIALLCVLALIYLNRLRILAIAVSLGSPLLVAFLSLPKTILFTSPLLIGGIIADEGIIRNHRP